MSGCRGAGDIGATVAKDEKAKEGETGEEEVELCFPLAMVLSLPPVTT